MKSKSLCFLVFNEQDNLKYFKSKIQDTIQNLKFDSLFAIDNSNDGSKEILKEMNVEVIDQTIDGRGGAIIQAISHCKTDYLILFSPDGNENIEDLLKFIEIIDENNFDLIIASRMRKDSVNEEDENFFKPRKIANNFFNFVANLFFNKNNIFITDSINGYRALKVDNFKKINFISRRFTIEYEMTIKSFKNDYSIYEFSTIENKRVFGKTRAKSIRVGLDFIFYLFREIIGK